jgi:hypothetical protein
MPRLSGSNTLACSVVVFLSVIGTPISRAADVLTLDCSETGVSVLDSNHPQQNNPIIFESVPGASIQAGNLRNRLPK